MAKLFLAALPLVAAVAPEQVCALEDGGYRKDSDAHSLYTRPPAQVHLSLTGVAGEMSVVSIWGMADHRVALISMVHTFTRGVRHLPRVWAGLCFNIC